MFKIIINVLSAIRRAAASWLYPIRAEVSVVPLDITIEVTATDLSFGLEDMRND